MKKSLFGAVLLLAILVPISTMAQISVNINIPLPPPITFAAPPEVIAMPEAAGVYVAPEVDVDLFFWNGFWWRLWEGRWFRSAYYDRGWGFYNQVPSFYFEVDPHWREYYRSHNWAGHAWNYEGIPYQRFQQNWRSWQAKRMWGGQKSWGIEGYKARAQQERRGMIEQRRQEYQQRPEVQRHMEEQHRAQRPAVEQRPQQQRREPQREQQQRREPQRAHEEKHEERK